MILAAGVSVRALTESAAASGYEVVGIDFYGDVDAGWQGKVMSVVADYGLSPTMANLLEIARTIHCHAFVFASGPENTPHELAYWENRSLLQGNGTSALTKVRNPWELRRSLKRIGVKMPWFCSVGEPLPYAHGHKWLLKPLNGGGGHGILKLPEGMDVPTLLSGLPEPGQFIVEEFIEGIPGSVTFLANGRKAVPVGTSRQLVGKGGTAWPFVYAGNIVPLDLGGIMDPQAFVDMVFEAIGQLTVDFGLKGINTLDFVVNAEGIWILELNPRWSASVELIERSLGGRLFSCHLAACAGGDLTRMILRFDWPHLVGPVKKEKTSDADMPDCWGKLIVYAQASGVVTDHDEERLRFLYEQGVRDIPRAGTGFEAGQPLCTVLARGTDEHHCIRNLQAKAQSVRRLLARNRLPAPESCQTESTEGEGRWAASLDC